MTGTNIEKLKSWQIGTDHWLAALWCTAVLASVLPPRMAKINLFVNNTLSVYRKCDDPHVRDIFAGVWLGFTATACLLAASTALLAAKNVFDRTPQVKNHTINFAVWAFVLATMWPLFITSADNGQPTRVLRNNPVAQWAFCNSGFDMERGKIGFGFYFSYFGAIILQPAPAMMRIAHSGQPVEVMRKADNTEKGTKQAWHYVMPGTGVYATFGNIATYASHYEFVSDMGFACTEYECGETIQRSFAKAHSKGHDAVQFTNHRDQICGTLFAEIVALDVNASLTCPITYSAKNNSECRCSEQYKTLNCGTPLNTAKQAIPHSAVFGLPAIVFAAVVSMSYYARIYRMKASNDSTYVNLEIQ